MLNNHSQWQGWLGRILVVIGVMTSAAQGQTAGTISTVAGIGLKGFSGDGGPATSAQLQDPGSVAVDGAGNIFIADRKNQRIRRVDTVSGIITTVAGNPSLSPPDSHGKQKAYGEFAGDGGLAINAKLDDPEGVVLDAAGNIYIADKENQRIRKIDATTGIITTFAGSPLEGGLDGNGVTKKIGDFAGDGGLAVNAKLHDPDGLAIDTAGNIFIADKKNQRIRRVDASTGIITTVAGNPLDGTLDGNGVTKKIGAYAGDGGLAVNAKLNDPEGVGVDATGNIYIADKKNNRIRKVDAATGIIVTIAGTGIKGCTGDGGAATLAQLNSPESVATDSLGNVYVVDTKNCSIRKVDGSTGTISTVVGSGLCGFGGDGGPAISAMLSDPHGMAIDSGGNFIIGDKKNQRIRFVNHSLMSVVSWQEIQPE